MVARRQLKLTPNELYRHSSARQALLHAFEQKKTSEEHFSLRSWAKSLGYNNPSTLSSLLRGRRKIKPNQARTLAQSLQLANPVVEYIELLAQLDIEKSPDTRDSLIKKIKKMSPLSSPDRVRDDLFFLIKDWYYAAILALAESDGLCSDATSIAARFGQKISPAMAEDALQRLERLGLVTIKGHYVKRRNPSLTVEPAEKNVAVREHHRQMISLSISALDQLERDQRNIQGSTLCIDPAAFAEVIDALDTCHKKLARIARANPGKHVFQFNTQFFPLTVQRDDEAKL